MQKILKILIGLTFCHNAAADYKNDILELCSVAKQGNFSQIQAKGQIQGDGSIKLATLGGKGELSFSKGEWNGVQQVLKDHQATDNVSARECVLKLMPYFKSKVVTPSAASKPAAKKTASAPAKAKSTTPPKPAAISPAKPAAPESDAEVNVETHGDKSPAIKGDGATVNYN